MRLRNITPKSLFGRMLAIILIPIILVQIISVFIFYDRHWDSVSRHMSSNLANDLGFLMDELGPSPSKDQRALSAIRARQYFGIIFYWLEGGILKPNQFLDEKFKNFKYALENRIKKPFYLSTEENTGQIIVDIQLANGIVRMNAVGVYHCDLKSLNLYKNGNSVHLTNSEQNLLKCFAEMPNKALSRYDINKCWEIKWRLDR